jgi:hypothetical protein
MAHVCNQESVSPRIAQKSVRQLSRPPGSETIEAALGHEPAPAIAASGGHSLAEISTMTKCADTAYRPDEQRPVDVASILAAGILRLRERQSLPVTANDANPTDSSQERLELSGETISVVHGG